MKNCTCVDSDFECEFNHYRNPAGACAPVEGAVTLSLDTQEEQCNGFEAFWYERTAYRKIPYSSCEGGTRLDRGTRHACPGLIGGKGRGVFFWGSLLVLPVGLAALAGWYFFTRSKQPGWVSSL